MIRIFIFLALKGRDFDLPEYGHMKLSQNL